jgi:hypothetical protein
VIDQPVGSVTPILGEFIKRLALSGSFSFLFCAALTLPLQFHVPSGFAVTGLSRSSVRPGSK